ncbi:hypothetical protein SDC9_169916 [bioreactor metagenome]|uniref:Uncharacterized protein n=1 Tax=bioreactor metagenome TaxID=1076179 RepID=A0A645GFI4_9ZZZZ
MKGAEVVAEVFGSGCLNIFFAKDGIKHIILNRSEYVYNEITFFDKISKTDVYYVDAYKELLPVHGGVGPFLLTLTPYLEEFFEEFKFKFSRKKLIKDFAKNAVIFYENWAKSYSHNSCSSLLKMMDKTIEIDDLVKNISDVFLAINKNKKCRFLKKIFKKRG